MDTLALAIKESKAYKNCLAYEATVFLSYHFDSHDFWTMFDLAAP